MPSVANFKIAQYVAVIILYIVAYWYSLKFAVNLNGCTTPACMKIKKAHESCLCTLPIDFSRIRGGQYYIGAMDAKKEGELKHCAATFWSASHFVLYAFLGFFAPSLFWETFAVGVIFEFYEKYSFDCHDVLDVAYNTAGFGVGYWINWHMRSAIGYDRKDW